VRCPDWRSAWDRWDHDLADILHGYEDYQRGSGEEAWLLHNKRISELAAERFCLQSGTTLGERVWQH